MNTAFALSTTEKDHVMHAAPNECFIAIAQLVKRYDQLSVLKGISLRAGRGEVIGLLGKNGAGKTTLLETLLGFAPASSGSVKIFGDDAMLLSEASKHRIGYVAQQDDALAQLNAAQYLDLISRFYRNWNHALVEKLMREWDIPSGVRIHKLSVGQRQKLSILTALGHEPELLVLDEPVASLDPVARRQFLATLIEIAAQGDRTVIFSTHIVSDLERIATRIWMLNDGHLQFDGDADALKESVVRLHIHATQPLSPTLTLPGKLRGEIRGQHGCLVVRDFSPDCLDDWQRKLGARIEVETLGLEDIFLELQS